MLLSEPTTPSCGECSANLPSLARIGDMLRPADLTDCKVRSCVEDAERSGVSHIQGNGWASADCLSLSRAMRVCFAQCAYEKVLRRKKCAVPFIGMACAFQNVLVTTQLRRTL